MPRALGLVLTLAATLGALATPAAAQAAAVPDWRGKADAMPHRYAWLDDITPTDTYTIVVVRGAKRWQVVRALGGVERKLGNLTPGDAEVYLFDHLRSDYSGPRVAQVQRLGHAIVVYAPYGVLKLGALEAMSRGRVAAEFFTDVEYDTYVSVAKGGRLVRQFDAGFKPPKKGALPQEAGLDWGADHQNIWATAWAFNERVTLTHISLDWFSGTHPTFVVRSGLI